MISINSLSHWGRLLLFSLFLSCHPTAGQGQERQIEVINTDRLEIESTDKGSVRRLTGNVELLQDTTRMFCDRARLYPGTNMLYAESRVRVLFSSGMELFADRIEYNGNTRVVELYDNIRLVQDSSELLTDRMTYYRNERYGKYIDGGLLRDTANTLESQTGFYYTAQRLAHFEDSVVMHGDEFVLYTDTLHYDTRLRKAIFRDSTWIETTDQQTLYTERGYYLSRAKTFHVWQHPSYADTSYTLKADTIYYDGHTRSGWGHCHVRMQHRDSSIHLFGEYGTFDRNSREVQLTDHPYLIYYTPKDTMVLFADTLYSIDNQRTGYQRLRAWPNVELTSADLLAICDSLEYDRVDSVFQFSQDPVMWSGASQLTGDTIYVLMENEAVDSLAILGNAFAIQQEDSVFFNQIKGLEMRARLEENSIRMLWVNGNSESIYIVKDGLAYTGLNRSFSKNMRILFKENRPQRIWFFQKPQATFYPIYEVWEKNNQLEGFTWRSAEKPRFFLGPRAQPSENQQDEAAP